MNLIHECAFDQMNLFVVIIIDLHAVYVRYNQ